MNYCPICQGQAEIHEPLVVRKKHKTALLTCSRCGFSFLENPHWLAEAYKSPINVVDTGYVARNLRYADFSAALIEGYLNADADFLDYGAGYGLFVRLMRDRGFNFFWQDTYTENLFARGFEWATGNVEMVTAFEVLEHVVDPRGFVEHVARSANTILITTELLPDPIPPADGWWYYGLSHGQHVSFYSLESLRQLGSRYGYKLISDGQSVHVLTRKRIHPRAIRRCKGPLFQRLLKLFKRRVPRTAADHSLLEAKIDTGEIQA